MKNVMILTIVMIILLIISGFFVDNYLSHRLINDTRYSYNEFNRHIWINQNDKTNLTYDNLEDQKPVVWIYYHKANRKVSKKNHSSINTSFLTTPYIKEELFTQDFIGSDNKKEIYINFKKRINGQKESYSRLFEIQHSIKIFKKIKDLKLLNQKSLGIGIDIDTIFMEKDFTKDFAFVSIGDNVYYGQMNNNDDKVAIFAKWAYDAYKSKIVRKEYRNKDDYPWNDEIQMNKQKNVFQWTGYGDNYVYKNTLLNTCIQAGQKKDFEVFIPKGFYLIDPEIKNYNGNVIWSIFDEKEEYIKCDENTSNMERAFYIPSTKYYTLRLTSPGIGVTEAIFSLQLPTEFQFELFTKNNQIASEHIDYNHHNYIATVGNQSPAPGVDTKGFIGEGTNFPSLKFTVELSRSSVVSDPDYPLKITIISIDDYYCPQTPVITRHPYSKENIWDVEVPFPDHLIGNQRNQLREVEVFYFFDVMHTIENNWYFKY